MFNLIEIKKKNVCIMGLMGSGKSIIGKDLSNYSNLKFYDTDKEIELKEKKSIIEIFEKDGEPYFRKIEEEICLELLTKNNCIISLGGGCIINKKIRQAINQNSYSIYLQVKLNNLVNRVKSSKKRPLLNKIVNKKETLENLYNERRKFYEKADFIVNNDNDKLQALEKIKLRLSSYAKENIHKE
ncbi:shikimate kinase [Pelagibacteraceae bacterium]|nr:shikimate kinase [Pelagibacteraceae bacterium]